MNPKLLSLLLFEFAVLGCHGFTRHAVQQSSSSNLSKRIRMSTVSDTGASDLNPTIAAQFKILTCSSTSCAKKRKSLEMDEYSTFSALWSRAKGTNVEVEECPCLGSCKMAPCVGIEHEDYEGTVALEDMLPNEFSDRVFHEILTEADADRVWISVENSIRVMEEQEEGE